MIIIIHNKLINKCYFGTFGKHSVFGNGDVSNRKPNLRNSSKHLCHVSFDFPCVLLSVCQHCLVR